MLRLKVMSGELICSRQSRTQTLMSWLQDRLSLDPESLKRVVLRLTPMVGGLAQFAGVEHGREPRADSCLASRETAS
jgi:hypothetical protein